LERGTLVIDGRVFHWIQDVLVDHHGDEVCEVQHWKVTPDGKPYWVLVERNGDTETFRDPTSVAAAVARIARAHPPSL
jgi:hypothetical protein